METIIPCRNCDHPLKSGSCLGCNMFRLYEALVKGKLDWAKDEYNGIVESKLEQPTLSPDDVRGEGKWEEKEYFDLENTTIEQMQSARCSVCGKYHTTPFSYYFTEYNYCPSCGARLGNGGTDDS